jgi:hypothetical protein
MTVKAARNISGKNRAKLEVIELCRTLNMHEKNNKSRETLAKQSANKQVKKHTHTYPLILIHVPRDGEDIYAYTLATER